MSILAGIFCRTANGRVTDAMYGRLRQALSRHPGDEVLTCRDSRVLLAKVDLDAYGEPAFHRDSRGTVSILAGEPLVVLGEDDPPHGRQQDLTLLHARWTRGDWSVLRHAEGTFCAIHYDPAAGVLTLIADKLGARPLYYWIGTRYVVFATALRILERLPLVPKRMNLRAVTEMAAIGLPLGDRTPYEDVALLRAAEVVRIGSESSSRWQYWRWDDVLPSPESESLLLREAYCRFDRAIARRARADRSVVAFLSGGMDSRAIVGALRAQGLDVHTINFGKTGTQDFLFAREFAQAVGTRHREVALPTGVEDTRRKMMIASILTTGDSGIPAADRPRMIWSGDGGSVGLGHVYMSRPVIDLLRAGRQDEAIDHFLTERGMSVAHRVLRRSLAGQLVTLPADGIREELQDLHCADPGRSFYLFLMLNDQRRHLARHFEDLDLHRLEFHLPFFDGRFVELITSIQVDWCLGHRFYTNWLGHFPPVVTAVPWQTYPGHEPCPVPLPRGVRYQWDQAQLAAFANAQKAALLHQAREMLQAPDFPRHLLRRHYLRLTTLLYRAGVRDYGYVISDANMYYTFWRRCASSVA